VSGMELIGADGETSSDPYGPLGHKIQGPGVGRAVRPSVVPLWLVVCDLAAGASIEWPARHGDEGIFVLAGRVAIDGKELPVEGAAIIETDVETSAMAVVASRLVHVGPNAPAPTAWSYYGAPASEGRGVHGVGPKGLYATAGEGNDARFYAESTCPTCRITLFFARRGAPYESPRHSHSQDELIFVTEGQISVGRYQVGAGDTLAVAANTPYRYRIGTAGFAFLNYHPDASKQWLGDDRPLVIEGGAANNFDAVSDLLS
jgi:quercetin dioxygenase-like cupin family protein